MRNTPRRAFTLVELLVVIAFIAILIALLMSAVQRARSAATLAVCEDNLRQVGLGLHQHLDQRGLFPSNGGWDGMQTIPATNNLQFTPETFDFNTQTHYQWGTGEPGLSPPEQTGSWAYAILPYLEQESVFKQRKWMLAQPLYACPARRSAIATTCIAGDVYADYISGGWTWGKTDYAANLFAFENRPTCYSDINFQRGLSNTILVGEKAYDPAVQGLNWYFDEPFFLGGSKGTHRGSPYLYRDGVGIDFKEGWGSNHTSGVNFLFGDGSVRTYGFGTDPAVISGLLSLN